MKAISKKSRKKDSRKISRLTRSGSRSRRRAGGEQMFDPQVAVHARNTRLNTVAPIRMKITKLDRRVVCSIACAAASRFSRRLRRPAPARRRAHGAAFGGRGDAHEDGAQHQEDQHQRRHHGALHPLSATRLCRAACAFVRGSAGTCRRPRAEDQACTAHTGRSASGWAPARRDTCRRPNAQLVGQDDQHQRRRDDLRQRARGGDDAGGQPRLS
jgi:hypothetical protein